MRGIFNSHATILKLLTNYYCLCLLPDYYLPDYCLITTT